MLEVRLLGTFEACVDGQPLAPARSRKEHWLLALLALRANRPIEREWLEEALWPECEERSVAHDYLRHTLSALRRALGANRNAIRSPSLHTLQLDAKDAKIDVVAFDAAIESGDIPSLERAISLYRGPLLEGYPAEWVLPERVAREEAYLTALQVLAARAIAAERPTVAVNYLRRHVAAAPLRESGYVSLMQALSACGDHAEVARVYRDLRETLHSDLNTYPTPATQAVYQSLRRQSLQPIFPQPQPRPPRRRLPVPTTRFIGRAQDTADVMGLFKQSRMVTLTGVGGVGKTRLSISVAEALEQECADGIWFVELAALTAPQLVPRAVAQTLNVREKPGQRIEEALALVCADRSLLLILDNCEHVLDACSHLAEHLLSSCPALRIVATSRQSLGLMGEWVYPVPSLEVPPASWLKEAGDDDKNRVHHLLKYAGPQLFLERARARKPDFRITTAQAEDVAQLCRRLDGIPLAIELAAGWVRSLSVEEINTRLTDVFALLTNGARTALPRHKRLRATFDWSYDLLTATEQALLSRLSVFRDGWTLEAAQAVCAEAGCTESREVLDLLRSLEDQSLIVGEQEERLSRYRLLEIIRQFAANKLSEKADEEWLLRRRHRDYFLALAEQAEPRLIDGEQGEWLQRLAKEHDNLRAALECSLSEPGSATGLRLCGALPKYWVARGHYVEGRNWYVRVLGTAEGLQRTLERAKALKGAGELAYHQGDYAAARRDLEESVAIRRERGDLRGVAISLNNLGNVVANQGDYASAWSCYEESLAIFQQIGREGGIASALNGLGCVADAQGNRASARTYYEESLALFRKIGDRARIANSLSHLGALALSQGDSVAAHVYYTESRAICGEIEDRSVMPYTLNGLGLIARSQGDYALAARYFAKGLAICRENGDRGGIAYSLSNLGKTVVDQGDYAAALPYLKESLTLYQEIGSRDCVAASLEAMAHLAAARCETKRAVVLWGAAEAIREAIGSPLSPDDREAYDRAVVEVRRTLGEEAFLTAREEGRSMIQDRAIEYALAQTAN